MTVLRLRRRIALACACLVLATSALTLISATTVARASGTHHDGRADYSIFYDQGGRIAPIQEIAQFIVPGSSAGDGNRADAPPPVIVALRPQRVVAAASRTVESDHPRGPPATRLS